jgi:hypothetical protein
LIGGAVGFVVGLHKSIELNAPTTTTADLSFETNADWVGFVDNVTVKLITTSTPDVNIVSSDTATTALNIRAGGGNYGFGTQAMLCSTVAGSNYAMGFQAGRAITTGSGNTLFGYFAGRGLSIGTDNTLLGYGSGINLIKGIRNVAVGSNSLGLAATASDNIAIGFYAGNTLSSGTFNIYVGDQSGRYNVTGGYNVCLGYLTGYTAGALDYTGVSNNIFLGSYAGRYAVSSNLLIIDSQSRSNAADQQSKALLYGVMASTTNAQSLQVNAGLVDIQDTVGGILRLSRNDTTATAADVIGTLQWWNNDTQLTTQNLYASIVVTATSTVTTDAAAGTMKFNVTGSTAGGSPIEHMAFAPTTVAAIGFFGATPVTKPTAYTQTYSTASKTVPNATASNPPAGGTGTTAGAYDTAANRDAMITSLTNEIADLAALKKVVNSLIDDLQALGLVS